MLLKDDMENTTITQNNKLRRKILTDLITLQEGIDRHFIHLKAENSRLSSQVSDLKEENISVDKRLVVLDRKVNELEYAIGSPDEVKEVVP